MPPCLASAFKHPRAGILALVLVLATGAAPAGAAEQGPDPGPAIYQPVAADFRPAYLDDPANVRVQTWAEYWGWVTSYYQGNLLASGWVRETETCLTRVTDPARRGELLRELNEAGRLASREWAKDGTVRKIQTSDLLAWGNRLKAARRAETGSGVELLAAVRLIHAEARRKVAAKPAPG